MFRTMPQANLHPVRVTRSALDYESSCGIDELLLNASSIQEFQYIEIHNVANSERFATYAIRGAWERGDFAE
jgi:aspartate 1-decarboxylase